MPSLIPRFEYDIFISYRQKDNRGDHWVTEFVTALKTELEATFKEDIPICSLPSLLPESYSIRQG